MAHPRADGDGMEASIPDGPPLHQERRAAPPVPDPDQGALERLTAHAPHAIAMTEGASHRLRSVNPAFCRLLRVAPADVLGRAYADCFPAAGDPGPLELLDRVFRSGTPAADEELARRDGAPGHAVWSYTVWPRRDGSGAPVGLVVEISDRTPQVEAQRHLEEMADQIRQINERLLRSALEEQDWAEKAEAASRAKSDFLAMMSHELRTPLTGIVGYTDVLDAGVPGPVTARQRECLDRIRLCSEQLTELISDVLSFAQVETHTLQVSPERVDLCALAREAAAVVEPVAARKGVDLRVETPEAELTTETDPMRARQILLNLLSNALKFTEQGTVRLEVLAEPDTAVFRVSDTGIGISAADLDRVFEPFVQSEQVTTRRYGGTGLGLSITRSLATMLGGRVEVRSTLGVGSTFSVRLPRLPAP
jgi:signal transduction histidine kinase